MTQEAKQRALEDFNEALSDGFERSIVELKDETITIIRECLSQPATPEGWRPIETAPKDGTKIMVTRWPTTGKTPYNLVTWARGHFEHKGWNISQRKRLRYEPTHWMPLPAAPVQEEK